MSTQLKVPYTNSLSPTEELPIDNYCSESQKIRELYISSAMTAMVAVVGSNRHLTMHVSVLFKKLGGDVTTILMNSNNTRPAPAMTSSVILAIFLFLASCCDIPLFAVKGLELTITHIESTGIINIYTHLGGLPTIYPLGYGKSWMEDGIFEMRFISKVKHTFGDKPDQWLNMVIQAFMRSSYVQNIYSKLETEDTLARHFGPQFVSANSKPGGPDVYVSNINASSNKESYDIIKGNL